MEKRNFANYIRQLEDTDAGIRASAVEYIRRYIEYSTETVRENKVIGLLGSLLVKDDDVSVRSAVSFAMVQMATYDPEHLIKFKATLENLVLGARNEKDEYTRTNCFEALSILTEYNIEAFQETKVVETLIDIKQNVATIRDRFRANRILHIFYANELGKKHLLLSIQSFLENDPDKIRVFLEENNWNDLIEFQE